MNSYRELSLLGLAAKAGKIVSGEFATENAVKSERLFWCLWQRTHRTTQEKNSKICVRITKYLL